ncbi:hypothetical protein HNQ93_003629 [Hymenobacter luteus]|uniref:STAS/SEC14 domain-containing protein n=2 Tax=Hymenobacter TaxID=89966 RepID=A0A7W9T5F5_9BACT|nr:MULTISPECIES: hypothetical protein [Hymenobacter]MBB4602862.1 hypothetical protein [Hymenobacter latericoloratus]MBB6060754.1 hypothetical protein [Hymenobacter luteus]
MQHIILETPGLVISYDYTNQWLYADWRGEHDQDSTRAGCGLMLEALSQWPSSKILNDNSNVTSIAVQLTTWGIGWLQAMYVAGLRYLAWIYSPATHNPQVVQDIIRTTNKPIVASFHDLPSARIWLRQQKATT